MAYFRDVCGWDGDASAASLSVIVAHVSIDYKAPIFLGDQVALWVADFAVRRKQL